MGQSGLLRHPLQEIPTEFSNRLPNAQATQCNGATMASINVPMLDGEDENNDSNVRSILREGNFSKVETCCLSIRHEYSQAIALKHLSMLPLFYEKCLLHNLGDLTFVCVYCGALSWKAEGETSFSICRKELLLF